MVERTTKQWTKNITGTLIDFYVTSTHKMDYATGTPNFDIIDDTMMFHRHA